MPVSYNNNIAADKDKRRVLPPGVEDQVTFGIMWIRIGKLKLTRSKAPSQNKTIIQFWGEKTPAYLQTKSNLLNKNEDATLIEYDIKCPITYFKEYLLDMKKNLKFQVQDVGKVDFDITKFIKPNIDLTSRYVFDHFKGVFQITGHNHRKIGSLEIQMSSNFNPQIAALELGQDVQQNRHQQNQENQNQDIFKKQIKSPGINKKMAIDILAIEDPQLLKQFYQQTVKPSKNKEKQIFERISIPEDNRIANSLNTQMSTQKFNPNKYLNEQKRQLIERKGDLRMKQNTAKQQLPRRQSSSNKSEEQISNFPTIQKVLTYSNLRLAKEQGKQQKRERKNVSKNISGVMFQQQQPGSKIAELQKKQSRSKQLLEEFYESHSNNQQQAINQKYKSVKQIQDTTEKKENKIQQPQSNLPNKRQSKQVHLEQSNLLDEEKQILSRVVNLDQQLKKSSINSPVKQKLQPSSNQFSPVKQYTAKQNQKIVHNQNQIRPVTQQRTQFPPFVQNKTKSGQRMFPMSQKNFNPRMTKPSSLILNLIVQIDTKSISFYKKKQKFHIIHRPYGCKQRIKLGPRFQSDKLTIICPISEQLVNKMDKLPFIIQFWGAVSDQFLGFIKINLNKIKKGFTLQGRLNQIAIKSSLLPIIIQKGQITIQNVNGQKSGLCSIYAAIGTSSQIQLYINSDRNVSRQRPQKQQKKRPQNDDKKKKIAKQQNQHRDVNGLNLRNLDLLVTNLLQYIDKSSTQNIVHLAEFMKKNELTEEQFEQFIYKINPNQQRVSQIGYVFKNLSISSQIKQHNYVKTSDFKRSFDQFKELKQELIKQFKTINSRICRQLPQNTKNQIMRHSNFNIIQKGKLNQIYLNHLNELKNDQQNQIDYPFQRSLFEQYFLTFFDQYINVSILVSQENTAYSYQPPIKCLIQKVYQSFNQIICRNNIHIQDLQIYFQIQPQNYTFQKKLSSFCQEKLKFHPQAFSLWYWLCLTRLDTRDKGQTIIQKTFIQKMKNQYDLMQNRMVLQQKLASLLQKQNQKNRFDNTNNLKQGYSSNKSKKQEQNKPVNKQKKKIEQGSMTQSNIHQLLNNRTLQNLVQNTILPNESSKPNNILSLEQSNNVFIQKQNIDNNTNSQISYQQKQIEKKYVQYLFVIKGVELYLQSPFDGQCQLNYQFPYDEEQIMSKKIKTIKNKHKYTISLYGQHKITIDNDIQSYMNQVPLKFQLLKLSSQEGNHIILQGDLHSDEVILENNQFQTKVVPLFGEDDQKIQAKVKIQIQYKHHQTEKSNLGKQTIYNLFLPKNGFVNFNFEVSLEQKKIKSQYNFSEEQFYVAIVVDFFNQNKNLKPHYPPISSKLFSNLSQAVQFRNSFKLSLNPTILDYIKQKNCLVYLNIIYYDKQNGNFTKKQITFATLKIPLFNLIKQQGVGGNYAFKNKYGMFVGLCKTEMKYDKYSKRLDQIKAQIQLGLTSLSKDKNKSNNFWIIVHFKELINFQPNTQSTFVKFQTIFSGTKYQTQKIHISDDPLLLFNDLIALSMTEQQFYSTKILPISIQFDKKQKFAFDISLKPVVKKLSTHKYFVSGGYFLVSNEDSQLTKMRVGARLMAFKGSSALQSFITSLCNNIDIDVFSQIDLSRDLQNYSKLLQLFKNGLKLSTRVFQQSLKQLINNKNQKISYQLLSSQLLYKLDLTPIIAQSQQQVDSLIRNSQGSMGLNKLPEYVEQNQYKLTNFHPQIINKYTFQNLWSQRIDKNVQFFNLSKQVDVLTMGRKIKVFQGKKNNQIQNEQQRKYKQLRITLQRGINFHYLYNGIKPNVLIRIPQLGYQSKIKSRTSEPTFDQTLREIVQRQNQNIYRHLSIQVYHMPNNGSSGDVQQILIGQGLFNIYNWFNLSHPKHQRQQKQARIIIQSALSGKMKAHLQVSMSLNIIGEHEYIQRRKHKPEQQENIEEASRIQQMIKDINKQMEGKKYLFENSSDDDY